MLDGFGLKTAGLALAGAFALGTAGFAQEDTGSASDTPILDALSEAGETIVEAGEALIDDINTSNTAAIVASWPVPDVVDVVCPFGFDYEPGAMSCGFISVPENRENPDSRMIRLLYVKIASTAEDEADKSEDPVIYLTGGPGVVVEGYADRLREHDILAERDLYILEQRGIANSGDFCPQYDATHRDLAWGDTLYDQAVNTAERMRNCFQTAAAAGVDVSGYSTLENARDVRALRQALGFEDWNVWGISYGSHLGQMVLNVDPEGTRAMVIDAIVPNDLTDLMRLGRWVNLVLENVFTTCADDPICEGLPARFDAALEKMKNNPVTVETDNLEVYPEGRVRFGGEILLFAPFMMMYEQDQHPAVPAVIESVVTAVENDDMALFDLLAGDGMGDGFGGSSQGMSSAIRCNDGYYAAQAEVATEDLAENPRFQGLGFSAEGAAYTAQVCVDEGLAPRRGTDMYQPVQSDIPLLVVNGAWDPVTPPPLAEYIMPGLTNARLIEVPFAGHGPTRSLPECAGPMMNAFFDNPDPAALDASCLEEGVAEPGYLTLFNTSATLRIAGMASDDPKTLVPAAIWAGSALFIFLLSLFIYPIGWLARRLAPSRDLATDTGNARWLGFATAIAGLGGAAMMGVGGYELSEVSEIGFLAGFGPSAMTGAWLFMATGLLGALTVIQLFRAWTSGPGIRIGSVIGVLLTGLAGIALAAFAIFWDLAPF